MIIFIAGLPGTGKTSLARGLSQHLKIPYYEIDDVKKTIYPTDPHYEHNLKHGIPFSDATRMKVFDHVATDFQKLAQSHQHLIVDETFHKAALRDRLFNKADETFGKHIVIWIQASDNVVRGRLEDGRKGHILTNAFEMYSSMKKVFEPFTDADIIFHNNGTDAQEAILQLTAKILPLLEKTV